MFDVKVKVEHNDFARIAALIPLRAAEVVEATGQAVAAGMRTRAAGSTRIPSTIKVRRHGALRRDVEAGDLGRGMHAGFLNWGTVDLPAVPFVEPSAEAERSQFVRRMKTVVRGG